MAGVRLIMLIALLSFRIMLVLSLLVFVVSAVWFDEEVIAGVAAAAACFFMALDIVIRLLFPSIKEAGAQNTVIAILMDADPIIQDDAGWVKKVLAVFLCMVGLISSIWMVIDI